MSSTSEPEKKESQTPRPESATSESQEAAEQTPITEVDVLHTFVEEYKTRDDQNSYLQRRNFWLGVTTAVLLFAYTTITALQWCAILESNRINREALTSVQRAYVSLKGIVADTARDIQGKVTTWSFYGEWENSGTTPTQTLRQHSNFYWGKEPFPDDYDFRDIKSGKNTITFIAPKSTASTGMMVVSSDVLREVQEQRMHLYFWGWAAYRDVFKDSKVHLAEFCRKVTTVNGNVATGTNVRLVYTHCHSHNCADESCEDYADAERRLEEEEG